MVSNVSRQDGEPPPPATLSRGRPAERTGWEATEVSVLRAHPAPVDVPPPPVRSPLRPEPDV